MCSNKHTKPTMLQVKISVIGYSSQVSMQHPQTYSTLHGPN